MNSRQFFDLVRRMRAYQREYDKRRLKSDLQTIKMLESQVYAEIKRVEIHLSLPDVIQRQQILIWNPPTMEMIKTQK